MDNESCSTAATTNAAAEPKKSWYCRYQDAKSGRNNTISTEDLKKYTGMNKDQLSEWSKNRPGVGGNRYAGDIATGPASGLGGMAAGDGYGGWGMGARGSLKFPPQKTPKKTAEEEDDD